MTAQTARPTRDLILAHVFDDVELRRSGLGNGYIGDFLQLGVELFEEIFEEEGEKTAGQLESLVAVVIAIVKLHATLSHQYDATHHQGEVGRLYMIK